MWLTQGHQLFAAFSETGIQKVLNSVYAARPHYFNYATPSLGGGSSGVSSLSPLPIPGGSGAVDYKLQFPAVPTIQFYPNADPPPPQPVPAPPIPPLPRAYPWALNQFVLYAALNLYVLQPPDDLISSNLELWAFGHPQLDTQTGATVSLVIDDIETLDAGSLGPVVDYVGRLMLNGVLSNLQLSTSSITQGTIGFKLEVGPTISSQQLQIWGSLV